MVEYSLYRLREKYKVFWNMPLAKVVGNQLHPELEACKLIDGPFRWSGSLRQLVEELARTAAEKWEITSVTGLILVITEEGITRSWYIDSETSYHEMPYFLLKKGDAIRHDTMGIHISGYEGTWHPRDCLMIDGISYAVLAPEGNRKADACPVAACAGCTYAGVTAPGSFTDPVIRKIRKKKKQAAGVREDRKLCYKLARKAAEEEKLPEETVKGREICKHRVSVRKMLAEQQAILAAKNKKKK